MFTLKSERLFYSFLHCDGILPIVLYGCETWSLILRVLREECRLRAFKNKILRQIFGLKRDENGEWNFIVYTVHLI